MSSRCTQTVFSIKRWFLMNAIRKTITGISMQHKRAIVLPSKTKAKITLVIIKSPNSGIVYYSVHRFHPFVCKFFSPSTVDSISHFFRDVK